MRPIAKVKSLSESETTRESMSLTDGGGKFEMVVTLVKTMGPSALSVENPRKAFLELLGQMPHDERAKQLYGQRRTIGLGQHVYGVYDPDSDRRDMGVEALEELDDAVFYLTALAKKTGNTFLLNRALKLHRDLLDDAYNRGAI